MYSAESLITMADGTFQHINTLKIGDIIYNKLFKPVVITRLHIETEVPVVEIQLNNGTGVFYTHPTTKVLCHHVHDDGTQHTEYCAISSANADGAKLKNSMKIFSPESDVTFTTYNDNDTNTSLTKTLYCLHTLDSSRTFLVNKIITCCLDD